jgi:hypothetical protein
VTDHKTVSPGTGEVTLTGFAPSVSIGVNVSPGTGEVILTGFEPTAAVTNHQTVSPGTGELLFEGFTPTVAVSIGGDADGGIISHATKVGLLRGSRHRRM